MSRNKGCTTKPKSELIGDEALLRDVCDLALEMKRLRTLLYQHKQKYDMLLEEAIGRKLDTVGRYCLILKPKTTRVIDMAAVCSMFPRDEVEKYATMSLTNARKFMNEEEIKSCSVEHTDDTWFVADKHGPWDRGE